MKWAYLPIMFALSFIYTKFSFNDFSLPKKTDSYFISKKRAPASEENVSLEPAMLKRVPSKVLYKNLEDAHFISIFKNLAEFRGTVVGDPHVESFGFVIDDKSKPTFAINDFKDVSEGVLMHDVIAHLVSAKDLDKKISWINYFEAYKSGLQGQPHVFSYYVEQGLEEAAWETQKTYEQNVTSDFPFEFIGLKKTHHHVDAVKKSAIQNSLKKKYPKIQFFDLYENNTEAGKFEVLVRVRPQDKIQWVQMVESSICNYDQAFNQETKGLPFEKRFLALKEHIFSGKMNQSLETVEIDKKSYTLKFADHFAAKLTMSKIPSDDYLDIIMDEAYVLGKIHRNSLGDNTDDYIKAWATITGAAIDEKMIELKYRLKDFNE